MQFFALFVIGAVLIGAGAMLSPAWLTAQPRVGLASSFALALVAGGAVFWAALFGWDTLVIDYLLFALVSLVILGGTMAQAQERAEARGEDLADVAQGWPGPEDLAFFALAALVCALPLALLPLPAGDQAAGSAMITLAARDGGTFNSLEPYAPQVTGFTPPAFYAIAAYLAQQLDQPIASIHMALGAVLAFLCIWTVYDLGAEIRDKRLGRAMALALILTLCAGVLFLTGAFTQLMAIVFALAFTTYALRTVRNPIAADVVASGLMLGAVLLTFPALALLCLLLYLVALAWRRIRTPGAWIGVPLVAALATAPWLAQNLALLPQARIDFTAPELLLAVAALPLALIGAWLLLALYERIPSAIRAGMRRQVYSLAAVAALAVVAVIIWQPLNAPLHRILYGQEPQALADSIAAMNWLAKNSPADALILNTESNHWVAPYARRAAIFYAIPDGYSSQNTAQPDMARFWQGEAVDLQAAGIDYVLYDGSVAAPAALDALQVVFEQGSVIVYQVAD
jgi:hypothetical protein